jgi:predicted Zn finger-like uncharacterized protein
MTFTCPKCKAKLRLPDEKIKPGGIRFKCVKCGGTLSYKGREGQNPQTIKTASKPMPLSPEKTGSGKEIPQGRRTTGIQEQIKEKALKETRKDDPVSGTDGPSPEDLAQARETYVKKGFMATEKERLEEKPFFEHFPDVIIYPFSGEGLIMLGIGTVLLTVLLLFSKFAFIFGIIGYVFAGGYLSSCMMKIVAYTADGEKDLPDWPDFTDWWDDIIIPMFQMIMVTLVSFAPLMIFMIFGASLHVLSLVIMFVLLIVGILYQPMALIAMSILRNVRALNPLLLVPAIAAVPLDYAIACGVLCLLFICKGIFHFLVIIPFVGPLLDNFIMLYLLMVEMRILGLVYYTNKEKFGWI